MSDKSINVLAPQDLNLSWPSQRWGKLYGSAVGLALAEAALALEAPLLAVTQSARDAERLTAELRFYLRGRDLPVLSLPDWETLPYDLFSPHQDIISERLATLAALPSLKRGIVVVAAATLMQRLAPPAFVVGGTLMLKVGANLDPDGLRQQLSSAGYASVTQVME